ncbi:hypothetical protein ILUMI_25919 [Ignelater luminosus]|uniref:Dehydrogenase E1 component domain-containing protein n=1 Tax=Ignelater luminosus TaxID=2038154 RepID=A0A8K0FXL7_IGNLU|nr:hypothetical protein ILUMI_25919 [Ignelater luminosus]
MAKIWNLPCLFLCENNHYAMGTSLIRGAGSSDFYRRGDYIPGIWVDGMDVLSVREAAKYALEHCASGKGPLVMELNTYRFVGHSMSDPDTTYRTRDEVKQERQAHDPIKAFKEQMIKAQLATEEDFKKIDDKVTKDVDAAAALATKDNDLPLSDLTYDIYKNNIDKQMRGVDPWSPWKTDNRPQEERPCTNIKSENVKK